MNCGRVRPYMRKAGSPVRLLATLAMALAALSPAMAQDARKGLVDAFVVLDLSSTMAPALGDAVSWVCGTVVDGMLQDGDSIAVYAAGSSVRQVLQGTIGADLDKETVKATVRGLEPEQGPTARTADLSGALGAVSAAIRSRDRSGRLAWVVLASAMAADGAGRDTARRLRYSRIVDHPGWREIVVGLDIAAIVDSSVRKLADELSLP